MINLKTSANSIASHRILQQSVIVVTGTTFLENGVTTAYIEVIYAVV